MSLARRLEDWAQRYGSDPRAWQREVHRLDEMEARAPKEALQLFHETKRRIALTRRAELLAHLRPFAFLMDVPAASEEGLDLPEIERDLRALADALHHARAASGALEEARRLEEALRERAAPRAVHVAPRPWREAEAAAREAAEVRGALAREARIEARLRDVRRRARKLREVRVALPDRWENSTEGAGAQLDELEARLAAAESLEGPFIALHKTLQTPEVATFRQASRKALLREARALLAADAPGSDVRERLRELEARARAVAQEAARLSEEAARARRRGSAPPKGEAGARDGLDMYG